MLGVLNFEDLGGEFKDSYSYRKVIVPEVVVV